MGKSASKVDLVVVDKPVEVEPEPWYQLAGWWEGLTTDEIENRIKTFNAHDDWAVVPPGWLCEINRARAQWSGMPSDMAYSLYMVLTQKNGYSPTHAQQAWDGARAFKARGEAE